jgi:hypothetical protein
MASPKVVHNLRHHVPRRAKRIEGQHEVGALLPAMPLRLVFDRSLDFVCELVGASPASSPPVPTELSPCFTLDSCHLHVAPISGVVLSECVHVSRWHGLDLEVAPRAPAVIAFLPQGPAHLKDFIFTLRRGATEGLLAGRA